MRTPDQNPLTVKKFALTDLARRADRSLGRGRKGTPPPMCGRRPVFGVDAQSLEFDVCDGVSGWDSMVPTPMPMPMPSGWIWRASSHRKIRSGLTRDQIEDVGTVIQEAALRLPRHPQRA
jgi:hypothetical protein